MASLVANLDIDPTFRTAIKLLHSPSPDSAEKIRNALDEIIKQRHGSAKMLVNTLNKKVLAEECTVPGTRVRSKSIETKQTITTGSGIAPIAVAISDVDAQMGDVITVPQGIVVEVPDEMETDDNEPVIEDDQFKEFENLMCIVCHQVDVSVRNPLVECIECQSLYHQDCHKPTISESHANGATWICTMCKSTKIVANSPIISSPLQTATPPSTPSSTSTSNTTKSSSSSHSSGYQSKSSSSSSSSKNYESSSEKKSKSSSSSRSSPSTSSSSKDRSSSSKSSDRSSSSSSKQQQSERDAQSGNGSSSNLDRQTSSGSSSSSSSGNGGGGSSSSKSVTPSINIISADKRLQIMKKKAAKMHETKRSKHK